MEKTVMSCIMCTAPKYNWGNQTNKNDKGGECSRYGRQKKCIQNFGGDV
jgi:hypothetical protein